jgi:hypothetical protein
VLETSIVLRIACLYGCCCCFRTCLLYYLGMRYGKMRRWRASVAVASAVGHCVRIPYSKKVGEERKRDDR